MYHEVGDPEFDRLLFDRVGLHVEHYPGKGGQCYQCKELRTPLFNMPYTERSFCIVCFRTLLCKFAAILVLQGSGGK